MGRRDFWKRVPEEQEYSRVVWATGDSKGLEGFACLALELDSDPKP